MKSTGMRKLDHNPKDIPADDHEDACLGAPSCLAERVDGALCQRSTEYSSPQSIQSDNFWDSDEICSVACQNAPVRERRQERVPRFRE